MGGGFFDGKKDGAQNSSEIFQGLPRFIPALHFFGFVAVYYAVYGECFNDLFQRFSEKVWGNYRRGSNDDFIQRHAVRHASFAGNDARRSARRQL